MQAYHYQKVVAILSIPKHRRVKFPVCTLDFLTSDFYDESNVLYPRLLKGLLLCTSEDAGLTSYV